MQRLVVWPPAKYHVRKRLFQGRKSRQSHMSATGLSKRVEHRVKTLINQLSVNWDGKVQLTGPILLNTASPRAFPAQKPL